jgi:hypothetical protein
MLISLLFHFPTPTCFGNCVPSSGRLSVASELHANLSFWFDKISCSIVAVCLLCRDRHVMLCIHTTTYYTECYQPKT